MGTRARAIAHANLAQGEQSGDHERLALADAAQVITLAPTASWPHRLEAFLLERLGRPEAAAAANAEATRLRLGDPSDDDLHFDALLALERQDHPTALRLFTELTARRPSDPATFMYVGLANQGLGQMDEAIKNYRWALALNPDDHYTHLELGRLLTKEGAPDQGASHLRRALELEPSTARTHDALADNLLARGRSAAKDRAAAKSLFEQAEQEARVSLALDPSGAWSRVNLGSSLLEKNRLLDSPDPRLLAEARDCYQELSSWRDDKEAYWNGLTNLCDALIQLRDLARALVVCREVTELQPDSAVGHYNLAGIHAQMNRPEEALAALERDIELGDHDWQYLAADPWFEGLRGDPRFKRLITEMRRAAGTDTTR
jgi:tetratricopeptide (TPR) repeat protein